MNDYKRERRLAGLADAWEERAEYLAKRWYDEEDEVWLDPQSKYERAVYLDCAEQLRRAIGQSS